MALGLSGVAVGRVVSTLTSHRLNTLYEETAEPGINIIEYLIYYQVGFKIRFE